MTQQGTIDRFACRALGLAMRGVSASLAPVGTIISAECMRSAVIDASPFAATMLRASIAAIVLGAFAFGRKGLAGLAAELEEPPPSRPALRKPRRLSRPPRDLRRPRR